MSALTKVTFGLTFFFSLGFGFLHHLVPDYDLDFNRLHIFLFNLCAGAAILLSYSSRQPKFPFYIWLYFLFALAYALSAFLNAFLISLALSAPLIAFFEFERIKRFSLFPFDFFKKVDTADKFLHASLLCFSLGIAVASFVIVNNEYTHWVSFDKLTIDVFFLGYSFPLSLLTFHVMFDLMDSEGSRLYMFLKEASFWSINVGVILFFVVIIFEIDIAEIVFSNVLFLTVIVTFIIFVKHTHRDQKTHFLMSGMVFLFFTAISGIFYIAKYFFPDLEPFRELLLDFHSTVAIYGWNMSGLFCVVRQDDFPIFNRSRWVLVLHWITIMIFAVVGRINAIFAVLALVSFLSLIILVLFSRKARNYAS